MRAARDGRPLVAVLVGTDHHPFDRLVGWVRDLAADGSVSWYVQHGTTTLPDGLDGAPILTSAGMQALLSEAAVVVTHGGPGLIMEARSLGHLPVVLPRDPALGEHVDDHQQRFVRRISAAGMAVAVDSPDSLRAAVAARLLVGRLNPGQDRGGTAAAVRIGRLVDDLVGRT